MISRILVLFLIISTICLVSVAQQLPLLNEEVENQMTFYLLDMESGLAHNVVNSIEQDKLGYIWIGTIEGVSRYNGNGFLNFTQNNYSPGKSLNNNFIQQILLRKNGDLTFATDDGINIYNPPAEKFYLLQKQNGLLTNSISYIYETSEEKTIIGAYNFGVQFLDQNGKTENVLAYKADDVTTLSSNLITSIAMQGDSIVWIGTFNGGLNKYNLKSKANKRLFQNTQYGNPAQINTLYTDNDANLWIGTKSGVKVITAKGDTITIDQNRAERNGLSDNEVLCFEKDDQDRMWIGTRNGGLNILSISDLLTRKQINISWFLPKSDGSSVYNRTVSALKMDKDANMWIGTSTGINFVNPRGESVKLLQRNPNTAHTLSHNRIGALAVSSDNKIWIGTDGGGLDHYDPITRKYKNHAHRPNLTSSLSNNYIISLKEDSKGRLWAGTYQGGLNRLDQSSGKFYQYLQGDSRDGSDVRVIEEDDLKQIWVGTNQGGLYLYSEEKDTFEYIEQLGKLDIRDISFDAQHRLWLATFGSGIICYNPQTKEIISYHNSQIPDLPGNIYFCLEVLPNQDVIAGSRYGGLLRINPTDNSINIYTESDGLSNNTISSMIKDSQGDIWLGTNKGISFYDPQTHLISHLNTYDNIQSSEFNIGAATYSPDGNLYFGGNKGINFFHPKNLKKELTNYPLVIENFKLYNDRVDVDNVLLDTAIAFKNHLKLNYNQTLFSFDFSVLKFPYAQHVTYAYKLDGYHRHWIQVEGNGTANLSNIPPGDYTLMIRADIGDDEIIGKEIFITVTPPFWKTLPAYILYIFLMVSFIIGFFYYYSERIKLKNSLLLEKKQRIMEHDINEERIRFFTSFSHELKTPLTLILAPLEDLILQIRSKSQLKQLALIQKNATFLHQLIGNLLEFRKSETGMSELKVGEYNLSLYLEQWVQNYLPLSKKQGVHMSCSLSERNMMLRFDFEKLQIIVNNLLSNAIKLAKPKDKIHVSLSSDESSVFISVTDSGPGISQDDRKRIFEWFFQSGTKIKKEGSGIGLALVKSLTELHGGTVRVESELNKGATFTIEIPKDLKLSSEEFGLYDEPSVLTEHISDNIPVIPYHEVLLDSDVERELLLLIDDNSDILCYLDGVLKEDYDIIHADNGKDGLAKALQHVPDLIISDIMMPLVNGHDLCVTLKQNAATTHIPVILLSALGNVESMQTGFNEGADDYITKPFNSVILKARVKNLIDSRKKLRSLFLGQEKESENLDDKQNGLLQLEKKFLSDLDKIILNQIGKEETQVDTIVNEMCMSRTSLFRKIKAITGYNINAYIRMTKLKKSADLIATQNITISQAAFESGFNDIKYFRKVFKEHFGYLPSEHKSYLHHK